MTSDTPGPASMTAPTSARGRPSLHAPCDVVTGRMLRRSLLTALLVGGALFAVNLGDTLARTGWTCALLVKLTVTMLIPFVVSLSSSVATRLEIRASEARPAEAANVVADRDAAGFRPPSDATRHHRSQP